MGQEEVYNALKKREKFVSAKDIATDVGITSDNVRRALSVLLGSGFVENINKSKNPNKKEFLWKIKK